LVLLDTGRICLTVTDHNGCTASGCFYVYAEDGRCFNGNGGNTHKVRICHHTSSATNPWVQICVDSSAVSALLAQGDYVGTCTNNREGAMEQSTAGDLFNAYPNPFNSQTTIEFTLHQTSSKATVEVYSYTGALVAVLFNGKAEEGVTYKVEFDGSTHTQGIYFYRITTDEGYYVNKLILTE